MPPAKKVVPVTYEELQAAKEAYYQAWLILNHADTNFIEAAIYNYTAAELRYRVLIDMVKANPPEQARQSRHPFIPLESMDLTTIILSILAGLGIWGFAIYGMVCFLKG